MEGAGGFRRGEQIECDRALKSVLMALGAVSQDKPNPNKDIAKAVNLAGRRGELQNKGFPSKAFEIDSWAGEATSATWLGVGKVPS